MDAKKIDKLYLLMIKYKTFSKLRIDGISLKWEKAPIKTYIQYYT